jgi:hypothetical protein
MSIRRTIRRTAPMFVAVSVAGFASGWLYAGRRGFNG